MKRCRGKGTDFREMAKADVVYMVKSMKCMREKPEHPTTRMLVKAKIL